MRRADVRGAYELREDVYKRLGSALVEELYRELRRRRLLPGRPDLWLFMVDVAFDMKQRHGNRRMKDEATIIAGSAIAALEICWWKRFHRDHPDLLPNELTSNETFEERVERAVQDAVNEAAHAQSNGTLRLKAQHFLHRIGIGEEPSEILRFKQPIDGMVRDDLLQRLPWLEERFQASLDLRKKLQSGE